MLAYDLARRLVSYTSPYKAALADTAKPTTTYTLDDGANIATAAIVVAGQTRVAESSSYPGGRLATRHRVVTPPVVGPSTTDDTTFSYSSLGEETIRTTTTAGGLPPPATITAYDAAGHVASAEGVTYAYDGADHLLSRRAGGETTLYFSWGAGTTLAEETDGAGATLARYVVDGADVVAQHSFRRITGAGKDPSDTAGTWAWLLDDAAGNMATTLSDTGAVLTQAAFDPYGAPEALGGSQAPGTKASSLGFQAALTDPTTKRVILGPRQYDPTTARFTNPDVFVGGQADLALGADALTGNRYLFAAANPVAYYEDGHWAQPRIHRWSGGLRSSQPGPTAREQRIRDHMAQARRIGLPPDLVEPCVQGGSDKIISSVGCRRFREALVSGRRELLYGPEAQRGNFIQRHAPGILGAISTGTAFLATAGILVPILQPYALGLGAVSAATSILGQAGLRQSPETGV